PAPIGSPCPDSPTRSAARRPPIGTRTTTTTTTPTSPPRSLMAADTADMDTIGLTYHGDAELAPGLVDLAVNVRRREPPDWLCAELARTLPALATYPDPVPAAAAVAARPGPRRDEVLLPPGGAPAPRAGCPPP